MTATLTTATLSTLSMDLGYAPMDAIHHEFEALMARATTCCDAGLVEALEGLQVHLRLHFAEENLWMSETRFPAAECHVAEHDAVLESAEAVVAMVAEGRTDVGRSFVEALAAWFPRHAGHLDSALAHWICKQRTGGKPVVIHRRSSRNPAKNAASSFCASSGSTFATY
jgi:hemerythrin-like metal-binding protein